MTVGRIFNLKGFKTVAEIGVNFAPILALTLCCSFRCCGSNGWNVNLRGLLLGFKSFSPSE